MSSRGLSGWTWPAAGLAATLLLLWVLVKRVGLAPQDVLLVVAVGAYATAERWRDSGRTTRGLDEGSALLGEDSNDGVAVVWWDFACEHHQLLGCVVRGKRHNRRGRSERFLSLAVSTLAMLYWKAIFRSPRVRMSSLQGLASSLWTLLISKGVQQLMKFAIRFFSGKLHRDHANVGWLDALQLQWQICQYWTLGFMMLCVMLALLEGSSWFSLLTGWCASTPLRPLPPPPPPPLSAASAAAERRHRRRSLPPPPLAAAAAAAAAALPPPRLARARPRLNRPPPRRVCPAACLKSTCACGN